MQLDLNISTSLVPGRVFGNIMSGSSANLENWKMCFIDHYCSFLCLRYKNSLCKLFLEMTSQRFYNMLMTKPGSELGIFSPYSHYTTEDLTLNNLGSNISDKWYRNLDGLNFIWLAAWLPLFFISWITDILPEICLAYTHFM